MAREYPSRGICAASKELDAMAARLAPAGRVFGKMVVVHVPILPRRRELLEGSRRESVAPIQHAGHEGRKKGRGSYTPALAGNLL